MQPLPGVNGTEEVGELKERYSYRKYDEVANL